MADAPKTALAEQRAQKKAARRAAFIQDVAEAVYSLGVQRQNEIKAKQRAARHAANEQGRMQQQLEEAELALDNPIEALYCKNVDARRRWEWESGRISFEDFRAREALKWAIKQGIFPQDTLKLPDAEGQFFAYATWKVANGKA